MIVRASAPPARLVLMLLAAACGGGTEPGGPSAAGVRVVSGGGAADTIGTVLERPLVVEVRDSTGRARPGVAVQFTADPARPLVLLARAGGTSNPSPWFTDTTDRNGRARAQVRFGTRAGETGVTVRAPALGLAAAAGYTIRPGAPVAVRAVPRDTAVYLGRTVVLRSAVVDRGNNAVSGAVTHTAASPAVTVSESGTVTGAAAGRAAVVVRAGGWADTARLSVVPVEGTVGVSRAPRFVGDTFGLAVVNLDGSGYRKFATEVGTVETGGGYPARAGMPPQWDPSGAWVVFIAQRDRRLHTADVESGGAARKLIASTPPSGGELSPTVSPDGALVYYSAVPAPDQGGGNTLWRVRADGTGAGPLPPPQPAPEGGPGDIHPAVSPDGGRVAYAAYTAGVYEPYVHVRAIATGARTPLHVVGHFPRWSPAGDVIAYVRGTNEGPIRLVRPDGTGDRAVTVDTFDGPLAWSPDGRYIVAQRAAGLLELIEVSTGARLVLPFTAGLSYPAWRPYTEPR